MFHNQASWLMTALAVAAVAMAGWYVGSRSSDAETTTPHDRTTGNVAMYRDIGAHVVGIDAEMRIIKLDHERIEGFMDAMTMDLKAADSVELAAVEVGQRVRFDLARMDGSYKVVAVRPDKQPSSSTTQRATPEEPVDPLERGDLVPDLALYDAKGERFGLHEMKPERKLITFFYVRCPIETYCPTQSRRLADLQQQLAEAGSDVHLVSLTLDGGHDGPAVLADYAKRFGADPARWTLAGGDDPAAVRRFANRAGARVRADREGYQIDHALIGLRVEGNRIVDRVFGLESIIEMAQGM